MIPQFIRVAAVDNDREHLDKIYSGLVRAGFWVMPFHYDLGSITPIPPRAFNGVRLIFTDIHLIDGAMNNMAQQALAIIRSLKKIVCDGPYAIIFWTQYPADAENVMTEIKARAEDEGFLLPVTHGCIDKSIVLNLGEDEESLVGLTSELQAEIQKCGALLLSISWEERVSQAAVKSTHRLFDLSNMNPSAESPLDVWHKLLSSLSTFAVGEQRAVQAPVAAMDIALLPILEDRLQAASDSVAEGLNEMLAAQFGNWPASVAKPSLNTHYLVERIVQPSTLSPAIRGMVSRVSKPEWDEHQPSIFGGPCNEVILKEFFLTEPNENDPLINTIIPCVVTLTPECDDVQGKVGSYRYLLAILFPYSEDNRKFYFSRSKNKYSNLSIFDVGILDLEIDGAKRDYALLISCNRFFARPTNELLHASPLLRLRRGTLEELSHQYATHARRPGVMRFF